MLRAKHLVEQHGMAPGTLGPVAAEQMYPEKFLEQLAARGVHADGRPLVGTAGAGAAEKTWRRVTCAEGEMQGCVSSCMARIGGTAVLCGMSLETAAPAANAPGDGLFVCNLDLSTLVSPEYAPGAPGDEAQVLNAQLDAIVHPCVPLHKLCIRRAHSVFVLYADVLCLSDDGAVLDTAVLATLGALARVVLPSAAYDVQARGVVCAAPPQAWRVPSAPLGPGEVRLLDDADVAGLPAVLTFAANGSTLIADPTRFEYKHSESRIVVAVAPRGIVLLSQVGRPLHAPGMLSVCVDLAYERRPEWMAVVDRSRHDRSR